MMKLRSYTAVILAVTLGCVMGCEEPKKEEPKKEEPKPATPPPEPEKEEPKPEPEKEKEPEPEPEKSELELCCNSLSRGAFSTPGRGRQAFHKAAAACRDAMDAKKELKAVLPKIKKELGSTPVPADCL